MTATQAAEGNEAGRSFVSRITCDKSKLFYTIFCFVLVCASIIYLKSAKFASFKSVEHFKKSLYIYFVYHLYDHEEDCTPAAEHFV